MTPFELKVSLPADLDAYRLSIEIVTDDSDIDIQRPYIEIVELFANAVRFQLLPRSSLQSSDWVCGEPTIRGNSILFDVAVKGLAFEAFCILVAMLTQSSLSGSPPKLVAILAEGKVERMASVLSFEHTIPSVERAEIVYGDVAIGQCLDLEIQFHAAISPEIAVYIDEALLVWDHLVFLGGYRFDLCLDEDFDVELGVTSQPLNSTIRHVLHRFNGPPEAVCGVLWLCKFLQSQNLNINCVSFEA